MLWPSYFSGCFQPRASYRDTQQPKSLVKPKAGPQALDQIHTHLRTQVLRTFPKFGNIQVVRILPGTRVEGMIAEYQKSGLVEYAELNYFRSIDSHNAPNDPLYSSLWNLDQTSDSDIDAPEAWHFRTDASSVVVAVIDSGVAHWHLDLAPNLWRNPGEIPADLQDNDGNGYVDDVNGIRVCTDGSSTDGFTCCPTCTSESFHTGDPGRIFDSLQGLQFPCPSLDRQHSC